ncbi:MAG: LamG domain-containing protein [Deltaproteobacteria bacterium]|nr:LamG domain-containing protein [Deltaproteobacteria bacterium]
MASSERIFCVLVALLGGCTLLTNADDHRDGTGSDMGLGDASVADAGDDDLGVDEDMGPPTDMTAPDDMVTDMPPPDSDCGVADLNGGSLVAAGSALYDLTDFTIEAWYRPAPDSLTGDHNLFGRWNEYMVTGSYALFISDGRPSLGFSCSGPDFVEVASSVDLVADTWVHLAATFDASTGRARVFQNGMSVASTTIDCGGVSGPNALGDTADLVLGYDDPRGGDPAMGLVDEARLSSIVRYTEEFSSPPRTFVSDGDTVALYQFEDDAFPAADSSDNDNAMTREGLVGLGTVCRPEEP